jgi:Queuine/archaeosine tRNA-ribosyltransferase
MTPEARCHSGADIILGNSYHLMLRHTAERIAQLGGLPKTHDLAAPDPERIPVAFR